MNDKPRTPGREDDLRYVDLGQYSRLLPEDLAGRDLAGAKLPYPHEIPKYFLALGQVKDISGEARKVFIGLLAACVYSWLVIGTTTDVALLLNTASSPLPIINTAIPIAGFYVVGGAILAAVYCYLHFYLQRLWRTLATLPAIFPDGVALDDKADPWLLTNLVRTEFTLLRRHAPPLVRLENLLAVFLTWWLVPLTLLALWARYLPAHGWLGTSWLVLLIFITTVFGQHTYRLAHAALQGKTSPTPKDEDRDRSILARAWRELRGLRVGDLTVCVTIALAVISYSGFVLSPRDEWTIPWILDWVGIRTYANLREVEVTGKPEGWDGKDLSKINRVDLRGRNLAFADAERAFLANADLRGANLRGVVLESAELHGVIFVDDDHDAQLQSARMVFAHLEGVDLSGANLKNSNLAHANLKGANLKHANLIGAHLWEAQLQGAELSFAKLRGADLTWASLEGAYLIGAELQGANLNHVQLIGADLAYAHLEAADLYQTSSQAADFGNAYLEGANLEAADLRGSKLAKAKLKGSDFRQAWLWRALVADADWNLADLRGANVRPIADVQKTIAEASATIPEGGEREKAVERLREALETGRQRSRPEFPAAWRFTGWQSQPDVMFNPGDPEPEPFAWGPPKWATAGDYDNDLAKFLGDLACGQEVPEEQTYGIARRALDYFNRERWFAQLLAKRLTAPGCRPAKGLPEDVRRWLKQLGARSGPP